MINHTVKGAPVGVKAAPDAGDTDARPLHAGVDQRLRHALTPGSFYGPELRHPIVSFLQVGNDDGLASIRRQNHGGVIELGEEAAIRTGAAGLFQRQMQVSAVDA